MSYRILAAAIMIALAACRPTGTYEVATQATPQVTLTTEQSIATSVIDRRPYVLNGDEDDDFLGTERANWGGDKDMKTDSGRPFADVLNDAVANALRSRGIDAAPIMPIEIKDSGRGFDQAEALAGFQAQPAGRLLLVEVDDWRTDIYTRVIFQWRLSATVFDRSGNVLASSLTQGKTPVARTDLKADYAPLAAELISDKLSQLLNARQITDALK